MHRQMYNPGRRGHSCIPVDATLLSRISLVSIVFRLWSSGSQDRCKNIHTDRHTDRYTTVIHTDRYIDRNTILDEGATCTCVPRPPC